MARGRQEGPIKRELRTNQGFFIFAGKDGGGMKKFYEGKVGLAFRGIKLFSSLTKGDRFLASMGPLPSLFHVGCLKKALSKKRSTVECVRLHGTRARIY